MITIRKKYIKEIKLEVIRMYENGERTFTEVEPELGITAGLLWKWKEDLKKQPQKERPFRETEDYLIHKHESGNWNEIMRY